MRSARCGHRRLAFLVREGFASTPCGVTVTIASMIPQWGQPERPRRGRPAPTRDHGNRHLSRNPGPPTQNDERLSLAKGTFQWAS